MLFYLTFSYSFSCSFSYTYLHSCPTPCRLGGRAVKARDALLGLGFLQTKAYVGSFQDWQGRGGEKVVRKEGE